ncbi:uncharacterized protein LOC135162723 isoform X2 [Diachasmimorpha longicaudata]|uniref:uncharacterized protein LOC135162723 isoform X2 n=1 Tax=Diachasmimorpha longicaudata TaxID=58733 RepID=UPI0030B8D8EC
MDSKEERNWATLEDLVGWAAATEEEDATLDLLKLSASKSLPEGWQMGRVLVLSNRELFGSEKEIDTLLFKKIEFAIPTLDVVMAFKLTATNLNEESFSACKKAMLAWPFCRALISSPPSLVNKVWGSIREAQKFVQSLATIRHLLTPWAIAAKELQRLSGAGSQLEALEESEESEEPSVKRSCLEALENRMTSMLNILYEKIDNQATQCPTSPQSLEGSSSDEGKAHRKSQNQSRTASLLVVLKPRNA